MIYLSGSTLKPLKWIWWNYKNSDIQLINLNIQEKLKRIERDNFILNIDNGISKTWNSLPKQFDNLKIVAPSLLTKVFSKMNSF